MAQKTQLLMRLGSSDINAQPDDYAALYAAGYRVTGIVYSRGGEGTDANTLFLCVKSPLDQWYVLADDVLNYLANGYQVKKVIYGSSRIEIDLNGANISVIDAPGVASAEVGTVAADTVVVTFTSEVESEDFTDGVTIEVNESGATISAVTRQTDHKVVHYTLSAAVANGDAVTLAYDDATGAILSEADGSHLDDVSEEVTNNVAAG